MKTQTFKACFEYQWKNELVSNLQENYKSGCVSYTEFLSAIEELEQYANVIP